MGYDYLEAPKTVLVIGQREMGVFVLEKSIRPILEERNNF
jgi:hypothetical protein